MLEIFCSFAVPMHRRGGAATAATGRSAIAHDVSTIISHHNGSNAMDCDDETRAQTIKRKMPTRIEAPTVESVTTACKRIKLVNSINLNNPNVDYHITDARCESRKMVRKYVGKRFFVHIVLNVVPSIGTTCGTTTEGAYATDETGENYLALTDTNQYMQISYYF